jgi:hypothetical protein
MAAMRNPPRFRRFCDCERPAERLSDPAINGCSKSGESPVRRRVSRVQDNHGRQHTKILLGRHSQSSGRFRGHSPASLAGRGWFRDGGSAGDKLTNQAYEFQRRGIRAFFAFCVMNRMSLAD